MDNEREKLPHRCEECGDDGSVYLSPRCHPGYPLFCLLTGDVLSMECAECGRIVGRLRVVSEPLSEEEAFGKPGEDGKDGTLTEQNDR